MIKTIYLKLDGIFKHDCLHNFFWLHIFLENNIIIMKFKIINGSDTNYIDKMSAKLLNQVRLLNQDYNHDKIMNF